jgi:hypothetical protein
LSAMRNAGWRLALEVDSPSNARHPAAMASMSRRVSFSETSGD